MINYIFSVSEKPLCCIEFKTAKAFTPLIIDPIIDPIMRLQLINGGHDDIR